MGAPHLRLTARDAMVLLIIGAASLSACSRAETANGDRPTQLARQLIGNGLSPFQENLLVDGEVTSAEYERAVFATVECIREQGISTTEPQLEPDGISLDFHLSGELTGDPAIDKAWEDRAMAAHDGCYEEHLSSVWSVYIEASLPVGDERRALLGELVTCLANAGFPDADEADGIEALLTKLTSWKSREYGDVVFIRRGEENKPEFVRLARIQDCEARYSILFRPSGVTGTFEPLEE